MTAVIANRGHVPTHSWPARSATIPDGSLSTTDGVAPRRALRLLARGADDAAAGGRADPAALPALRSRHFVTYPNEKLLGAVKHGAATFAEHFPGRARACCLIGPPGIGKTHLAVAVLRSVIVTKGARGLFYDVRDLLRVIRSTYNPLVRTAEMDILRPVMDADLLVLDDLGSEKTSEWVEETMNLIVNTRYNERRHTIFTSNYEDTPDDTRSGIRAQGAHRVPHPFAAARDVRLPRVRRRRLPPRCRPTPAATILLTMWKAKGRLAVRCQREPRARSARN